MTPILEVIKNKNTKIKPIWLMRQAGRYLPEFKAIREKNTDFIKLCLNSKLLSDITLQPIKRFGFDAAIVFSDILLVPHALGQTVNFKKDYGPELGDLNLNILDRIDSNDFTKKLEPFYKGLDLLKNNKLLNGRDVIGFVGGPWTVLLYMLNKKSPKNEISFSEFLKNEDEVDKLLITLEKFLKIHIKNQVDNGATLIQIFDSWAGLLNDNQLTKFVYEPTLNLVNYVKSLKVPVICFPRGIRDYSNFIKIIKPDVINIDYLINPEELHSENVVVQGGFNPGILLNSKEDIKKHALTYLNIFRDKPYIFNLGHGVLPETKIDMVDYLVKIVREFNGK
ncbi:MAG: uroporphyrinogen decarboxylase [Pelagibacteraceae bacterium TMED246]|nr:MAG: uroporphyrinogen decarboxylase [Pelagibacteraceae bacterium TMED246]|tara:strand:- start:22137 stop:23147 length:1011 start_codon:yes stop_codon:yes gene_type:complete